MYLCILLFILDSLCKGEPHKCVHATFEINQNTRNTRPIIHWDWVFV